MTSKLVRWLSICLALAALSLALTLAFKSAVGDGLPGCGEGSGCDSVLGSRWAVWLGIPVSYAAMAIYSVFLLSILLCESEYEVIRRTARLGLAGSITTAAFAGIWFIGLQAMVLGQFCLYCTAIHLIGVVLAALAWFQFNHWRADVGESTSAVDGFAGVFTGVCLAAALVAGQIYAPPKLETISADQVVASDDTSDDKAETVGIVIADLEIPTIDQVAEAATGSAPDSVDDQQPDGAANSANTDAAGSQATNFNRSAATDNGSQANTSATQSTADSELRSFLKNRVSLDLAKVPVIGNRQAKHLLVVMADYSCPHCRTLHGMLDQAKQRYGEQMALVFLPVPLNASCNRHMKTTPYQHRNACDYARLATAVWQAKPTAFEHFDDWLFKLRVPPRPAEARAYAATLIGEAELRTRLESPEADALIKLGEYAFGRCGAGRLPKMIVNDQLVNGEPNTRQQLYQLIEKHFGVSPLSQ